MSLQDDENESSEETCVFPVKNPFEEGLLERLSAPLISSPFFQSIVRSRIKSSDSPFTWSIEERSRLFPANIDESQHINTPPYSSDKEESIQLVIDRYFYENSIVPSPLLNCSNSKYIVDCESTSKSTESSSQNFEDTEHELNGSFATSHYPEKSKATDLCMGYTPKIPEENNVWTQTFLSLTGASIDDIVGSVQKRLPDQEDEECLSGRLFPRKLSFLPDRSPNLESTRISPPGFCFSAAAPELIFGSQGAKEQKFLNSLLDNATDTPCSSTPESKSGQTANTDFSFTSTPEVFSSNNAWTQTYLTLPPNCDGDMTELVEACVTRLQNEQTKRIEDCNSKRIQRKLRFSTEKSPHLFFRGRCDNREMTPAPSTGSVSGTNSRIIKRLGLSSSFCFDSPTLSPIAANTSQNETRAKSTRRCLTTQLLSPEGVLKEEESDDENSSIPDPSTHPSTFMEETCNDERLERLLEEDLRSLSPASSPDDSEMITSHNNSVSMMDSRGDTGYETGFKSRLSESGLTQGIDSMFMHKPLLCSDYDMQSSKTIDMEHFTPPESSTPNTKKHLINGKQSTCNGVSC